MVIPDLISIGTGPSGLSIIKSISCFVLPKVKPGIYAVMEPAFYKFRNDQVLEKSSFRMICFYLIDRVYA